MERYLGHIPNDGMVSDGEYYWFVEKTTNWLCKLSMDDLICEYIVHIPSKQIIGSLGTNSVGCIISQNIYCNPIRTNSLWKFNSQNNSMTEIKLPIKTNTNLYIVSSWIIGESLWLASCRGRVWEVSLNDDKVIGWYDINSSDEVMFGSEFVLNDNCIYGTDLIHGNIIRFDIKTKVTDCIEIAKNEKGFQTICNVDGVFYMTGKSNKIYSWNNFNQSISFDYLYEDDKLIGEGHHFIRNKYLNGNIFFITRIPNGPLCNCIYMFNIDNKKTNKKYIDDNAIKITEDYCLMEFVDDNNLYFSYSNHDKLYAYNLEEDCIKIIQYIIVNRDIRDREIYDTLKKNELMVKETKDFGLNELMKNFMR